MWDTRCSKAGIRAGRQPCLGLAIRHRLARMMGGDVTVAANQSGKSLAGAMETAMHATGLP
jgi:hypothetical protein